MSLSKAASARFKAKGVEPGEVYWKGEIVDMRIISLEKAEQLHKEGFPYLEPIPAPPKSSQPS